MIVHDERGEEGALNLDYMALGYLVCAWHFNEQGVVLKSRIRDLILRFDMRTGLVFLRIEKTFGFGSVSVRLS